MMNIKNDETDVKAICRAAYSYYKNLQAHCLGIKQLPEETIKFMADRLIEQVLILEAAAKQAYDELPEEAKKILEEQEVLRNYPMYYDQKGMPHRNCDFNAIEQYINNVQSRYDSIREEAEERINTHESDEI